MVVEMKKVLIISHEFNRDEVIGSIRARALFKYLRSVGWEPYILTTGPEKSAERVTFSVYKEIKSSWKKFFGINDEETVRNYLDLKINKDKKSYYDRLFNYWEEIFLFPDNARCWKKPAIKIGTDLVNKYDIDAVISTSKPETAHLIANSIAKKTKIPWIADYRDLWTQNHYYQYSVLRKSIEFLLENHTLKRASVVTTVSKPLAEQMKVFSKDVVVIPNGYDPDLFNDSKGQVNEKFTLVYTGYLMSGKRDPEPFFKAISAMIKNRICKRENIKFDFYGFIEDWVIYEIEKYELKDIVVLHGNVGRKEAITAQRAADVLVLLLNDSEYEKGVYTGKLFDYLAANKTIIAWGCTGGVVDELISTAQVGISTSDYNDLYDKLCQYYSDYICNGQIKFVSNNEFIKGFSHIEMSKKFSKVLDSVLDKK